MKRAILCCCVANLIVVACTGSGRPTRDVTFQVRDFQWTLSDDREYSFSYLGRGTLVASGRDADSLYEVAVEVINERHLNPTEAPDSSVQTYVVNGTAPVRLGEYASRCLRYTTTTCVREPQPPLVRFRVIGWHPMTRPGPPPAARTP